MHNHFCHKEAMHANKTVTSIPQSIKKIDYGRISQRPYAQLNGFTEQI